MLILFLVDIQYLKTNKIFLDAFFLDAFFLSFGIFITVVAALLNKYISQSFS